jgi:hypothetical protein
MRRPTSALLLAICLQASSLQAAAVLLRLQSSSAELAARLPFKIDAQRVGKNGFDPTLTFECAELGVCAVDVSPGTWVFSSGDRRIYIVPRSVVVPPPPSEAAALTLDVLPAAEVVAAIKTPPSVSEVSLDFRGEGDRAMAGRAECRVADNRITCIVPLGTWDLRIGSPGYMPDYRRAFHVASDAPNSLGSLSFKRGASVSGRIDLERGFRPSNLADLRVYLTPSTTLRTTAQRRSVTANAAASRAGVFYFSGVEPGEYVVSANLKGAVAETQLIKVLADREAQLRQPILIGRPKVLSARITPSTPRPDQSWRVRLDRKTPDGRFVTVTEGRAAASGEWRYENASPGAYTLSVDDDSGNTFAVREADATAGDVDLAVTIERVLLSGDVQMGDKPLAASVTFSSASRAKVVFKSDAEGTFRGEIPAGKDIVWSAEVESPQLGVERDLAEVRPTIRDDGTAYVKLTLPHGQLGGKVLFEDGRAATHGWVDVTSEDGSTVAMQPHLAGDGGFVATGLPDGKYALQAHVLTDAEPMLSEVAEIVVSDHASDPVTLTVRPDRVARGVVLSNGAPVVGATVVVSSTDKSWLFVAPRQTDTTGRFSTILPAGTVDVDVFVRARGFATRLFHTKLTESELPVRLAPTGGELTIAVPPWNNGDSRSPHPWLLHDGGIVAALMIGDEVWDEKRVVIQAGLVDPGVYALCMGFREQFAQMRSGNLNGLRCATATVPPFGRVELELKSEAAKVATAATK